MFGNIIKIAILCFVCALGNIVADAQQTKSPQTNSSVNYNKTLNDLVAKAAEYEELKSILPQENELADVLLGLQETARASNLKIVRFAPRKTAPQDFINAKSIEVEVECNFGNLQSFFDEMARLPRIVSINDFRIAQLKIQTKENTLNAQFVLAAYYPTDDSFERKTATTQELVRKIADFDARIETIKGLRAAQAAPSAVLEAVSERISMVEGLYLESIAQTAEQITIKGNAPNESVVTQFGRSLEFSAGLFSNLNIETQKQKPISNNNETFNFTISCRYNPLKATVSR